MVKLGKTVILGDSYSTFAGYIPEGNVIYYSPEDEHNSRVTTVEQTWWHQLISATDSELVLNESWSGSTIGYTGYEKEDYTHLCFNTRLDRMYEEGILDGIDTLLIFGGTNDDWCGAPEGELKFEGWTKEDMYCALPAIGRLFCRVAEILPDVNVYAIINTELKPCINDALIEAATRNGVKVIRLSNIDKIWGHPSDIGMTQIKDQLLSFFESEAN